MTSSQIRLRRVTEGDADFLFRLRNDLSVVATTTSREPVAPDVHIAWLQRVLNDPGCDLLVVCDEQQPVGQIRLDQRADGGVTVSVAVVHSVRGKGVGTAGLRLASDQFGGERRLHAYIRAENLPSIRSFMKAGFREVDPDPPCPVGHRHLVKDPN
jgi:UDP-2,4-diacetamido-2,4,6-trideoxy-beta-L-altropyranose hydrolase